MALKGGPSCIDLDCFCRYEETGEEDVIFQMISENATKVGVIISAGTFCAGQSASHALHQVLTQLDGIRKNRKYAFILVIIAHA